MLRLTNMIRLIQIIINKTSIRMFINNYFRKIMDILKLIYCDKFGQVE